MTRKDYVKIARTMHVIRDTYKTIDEEDQKVYFVLDVVCRCLADMLAQDNERFDQDKFFKACGMEKE